MQEIATCFHLFMYYSILLLFFYYSFLTYTLKNQPIYRIKDCFVYE